MQTSCIVGSNLRSPTQRWKQKERAAAEEEKIFRYDRKKPGRPAQRL
jgi:hypothetical protein